MKRIFCVLLAVCALLCLCSCKEAESTESDASESKKSFDADAVMAGIVQKYQLTSGTVYTSKSQTLGEYLDEDLIRNFYGDAEGSPDFSQVESYCVYIDETQPINPCDVGIFVMKDGADKDLFASYLRARIDEKLETAKNYPTVDSSALKTAEVTVDGKYIYYCFVKDGNADIKKTIGDSIG